MPQFSTWIYQIAVNICRDELKSRKRRGMMPLEQINEYGDDAKLRLPAEQGPEHVTQVQELGRLLNAALARIPEQQRVVVVMKEYQGLKFREIAHVLDISENTAKSRMYYGLKALRAIFEKWNITKESISDEL